MKRLIKVIIGFIIGFVGGVDYMGRVAESAIKKNDAAKFKSYYGVLNQWLKLKEKNIGLQDYFIQNGYSNIGIYGMGELGKRFLSEMKGTAINIEYIVDQNTWGEVEEYTVINKEKIMTQPQVDVLVVTATFAYDDIKQEMEAKVRCPIISLEDVVFSIE